jgi:hypothetical protein
MIEEKKYSWDGISLMLILFFLTLFLGTGFLCYDRGYKKGRAYLFQIAVEQGFAKYEVMKLWNSGVGETGKVMVEIGE